MEQLEARIVDWAASRPDIHAVLVVGSRARRDHPADEWSDLDLVIFTTDVESYRTCEGWLDEVGAVWVCVPFEREESCVEHFALLEGGQKVDSVGGQGARCGDEGPLAYHDRMACACPSRLGLRHLARRALHVGMGRL